MKPNISSLSAQDHTSSLSSPLCIPPMLSPFSTFFLALQPFVYMLIHLCLQFQEWCVFLSGRGLNPESEEPLSISSPIGSSASITIPFTNPTELSVTLDITLTGHRRSSSFFRRRPVTHLFLTRTSDAFRHILNTTRAWCVFMFQTRTRAEPSAAIKSPRTKRSSLSR